MPFHTGIMRSLQDFAKWSWKIGKGKFENSIINFNFIRLRLNFIIACTNSFISIILYGMMMLMMQTGALQCHVVAVTCHLNDYLPAGKIW